jgi:REP element-mobilizing transposase RayT
MLIGLGLQWGRSPYTKEFPKAAKNGVSVVYTQGHKWQRRFWEHLIRDETDFRQHIDYIHWNPVKHS